MKQALKPKSEFESELHDSYAEDRIWIRVKQPKGAGEADVGILVTDEGISIDVYPAADEFNSEPNVAFEPWVLWSDITDKQESK